jgi:hypothetical protein
MDNMPVRDPAFGDDYIPLLDPEPESMHSRGGINKTQQTQRSWRVPPRLERLFSGSMGYQLNSRKETCASGNSTDITSEIGVAMDSYLSRHKHAQGTNYMGEGGTDGLRSIDLSISKSLAPLISSGNDGEGGEHIPNTLPTVIPILSIQNGTTTCQVSSSSIQAACSLSAQSSNGTTVGNSIQPSKDLQEPTSEMVDFAKANIPSLGNPRPPKAYRNASSKTNPRPNLLENVEHRDDVKIIEYPASRNIQTFDDQNPKEGSANPQNIRVQMSYRDNIFGGIDYHLYMKLKFC